MAGMCLTNEAAFFQDFQSTINSDEPDAGVFDFHPLMDGDRGLVFMGIDNFINNGAALRVTLYP